MKLENFISETLIGIQKGVSKAIAETTEKGLNGVINPQWVEHKGTGPHQVRDIQFDVAVTVKVEGGVEGKSEISVMGINISAEGAGELEHSKVSRIQFSIPVVPPTTIVTPESNT